MEKEKYIIALVGNPNCGKTTVFNGLTGGNLSVGNWAGVTVEKYEGFFKAGHKNIKIVDLPGIYSLSAHSEDERVSSDYLLTGEAELIVNIVDTLNLERNLYLTTQLSEMGVPVMVVLNMMDMSEKAGYSIDIEKISRELGFPVIGINGTEKKDIERLKHEIQNHLDNPKNASVTIRYPNEIESVIEAWKDKLSDLAQKMNTNTRWLSIRALCGDSKTLERIVSDGKLSLGEIQAEIDKIPKILGDTADIVIADYRYGAIKGIVKDSRKKVFDKMNLSDKIDKVLLNKFLGLPIFFLLMFVVFWFSISFSGAFIDFFDLLFGAIFVDGFTHVLGLLGSPDWLITILAVGIGSGIQTVSTFIPVIFMMFLMLSVLEDSGYMARAAFVMDHWMRKIGLPGKSFISMLVGFGCTVPAVMGTRTLESNRDRLMTVFMVPYMSCGARLPVYALFASAFFTAHSGLLVFSLYLTGIAFAILTGIMLKKTLFRATPSYYIMELPPYHVPRPKHILFHTWEKLKGFILRAGKTIVVMVAILAVVNSIGIDGSFGNEDSDKSILSAVGKTLTPIFTPMGVTQENWPATVGIFTGLFAKESVVGTLTSLYSQMGSEPSAVHDEITNGNDEETATDTAEQVIEEEFDFGAQVGDAFASIPKGLVALFVPSEEDSADEGIYHKIRQNFAHGNHQAIAYLLFILLYAPCVAAMGAVFKEIGWKLGIVNVVYMTLLAWIVSTIYYQITIGHQVLWILVALGLVGLIIVFFKLLGKTKPFALDESKV